MRLKTEGCILAEMPFSPLEIFFFFGVWRGAQVQISRTKLLKFISHPIPLKPKTIVQPKPKCHLHPQNPLTDVQRSQAQKWAKLKKTHPLYDFYETEKRRTHYNQNTTSTLTIFFIGVCTRLKLKNGQNLKNSTLYPILLKLKTKGHITSKIPLPPF